MTDNEIIKALECCTFKGGCLDCPLYVPEQTGSCVKRVFINALDLINRQKAEIEKLQEVIFKKEDLMQTLHTEHQAVYDELVSAKAEIERLRG